MTEKHSNPLKDARWIPANKFWSKFVGEEIVYDNKIWKIHSLIRDSRGGMIKCWTLKAQGNNDYKLVSIPLMEYYSVKNRTVYCCDINHYAFTGASEPKPQLNDRILSLVQFDRRFLT